ncbi:MAG: Pr6Pr family membrane protein [Bauldia sp.]
MHRLARSAAAVITVTAAAGVVLLYGDFVAGRSGAALLWRSIDFFSFFTVESNLLVAGLTGAFALASGARGATLIKRPAVAGAASLYIAVTGVTYYVLLSAIYHPVGLGLLATNLLHYVVPPAYVAFWLVFVPKGALGLRAAAAWLAFPIAYAAYTLIRGPFAGLYPYPFIDAAALGYAGVLRSVAGLIVGFALAAILIVALDRLMGRLRRT